MLCLGLERVNQIVDVSLASADGPETSGPGRAILRGAGRKDKVLMDIQTDEKSGTRKS
jgi:hypothetical protein